VLRLTEFQRSACANPRLLFLRRECLPRQAAAITRIRGHCGQSLQSMIPIMISEPTATTAGQINGNSSSTATTAARPIRVLFKRAKRQPAAPIRATPFGPQQRLSDAINAKRSAIANSGVTLNEGEETLSNLLSALPPH